MDDWSCGSALLSENVSGGAQAELPLASDHDAPSETEPLGAFQKENPEGKEASQKGKTAASHRARAPGPKNLYL